jgi:hypothetical protein
LLRITAAEVLTAVAQLPEPDSTAPREAAALRVG